MKKLLLKQSSTLFFWLLSSSTFLFTGFSYSEESDAKDHNLLEEIVTVARRTEERLQDVPISVTAISAETIRQSTITSSTDLIKLIPSLNVQQQVASQAGPGNNYSLRGIRTGVVTYFNEVPIGPQSLEDQIWDLSSIQALAGPQGTLFGRNSTGGAILFVPQRPTDEFGGSVEVSFGDYNLRKTTAIVNIPINDMIKVRLGGRLIRRDGLVENLAGSDFQSLDRNIFRASIVFEPTDNISNYTVINYAERDEQPAMNIASNITSTTGCLPGPTCIIYPVGLIEPLGAEQEARGIRKVKTSEPTSHSNKVKGISNTLSINLLDNLTFKYVASYNEQDTEQTSTHFSVDVPLQLSSSFSTNKDWTHEIQFQGHLFSEQLDWTIGAFTSRNESTSTGGYALFLPLGTGWSEDAAIGNYPNNETESKAAFAQATLKLTEKLNVTAGVRYTEEKADTEIHRRGPQFFFFGPNACLLGPGEGVDFDTCTRSLNGTWDATTYNLSVDYRISDQLMVYVTARRGFNTGGFNPSVPDTETAGAPLITYDPEQLTDYEAGLKSDWHIGEVPVRTNISVFYGEYEDIQRIQRGFSTTGNIYSGFANGPKATIQGLQFEAVIRPIPSLTINANYGYLDTEYKKGTNAFSKGNSFSQAPEHTVNLSATYRRDLSAGGQLVGSVNYAYQSEIAFTDDQSAAVNAFQKGYDIIDTRLGWDSVMGSDFDITLFVKNLLDDDYAIDRQDITGLFGYVASAYNDPRTWGVEMRYRFGE